MNNDRGPSLTYHAIATCSKFDGYRVYGVLNRYSSRVTGRVYTPNPFDLEAGTLKDAKCLFIEHLEQEFAKFTAEDK